MLTPSVLIHADLDCVVNGSAFSVHSTGRQTVVEVPDVATGLRLMQLGSPRGSAFKSLHRWKRILDETQHSIELRVLDKAIVALGNDVGSRGWSLLGLPTMTFRPATILSMLVAKSQ